MGGRSNDKSKDKKKIKKDVFLLMYYLKSVS